MSESLKEIQNAYEELSKKDKGKLLLCLSEKFGVSIRSINSRLRGQIKISKDELIFLTEQLNLPQYDNNSN